jgi:hypothetical protein
MTTEVEQRELIRLRAEVAAMAIEIRDIRASYEEQFKTGLELESQRDAALLQIGELKEAVQHARYCEYAGSEIEFKCPECEKFNKMEKQKSDTCENYRDGLEIQSRYCSAFEANSQAHAPTCQFAEKPKNEEAKFTFGNSSLFTNAVPQIRLHPYTCGDCGAVMRTDICPACAQKRVDGA